MKKIMLITLLVPISCNGSELSRKFSLSQFITIPNKKKAPNDPSLSKRQSLVPKKNNSSFLHVPSEKKGPSFLEEASSRNSKPLEIPASKKELPYSPSLARSAPDMTTSEPPLTKEEPFKKHTRTRSRSHNTLELDQKPPTTANSTEELFSSLSSTSKNSPTKRDRPTRNQREEKNEDPLSTLRITKKNTELQTKETELSKLLSKVETKIWTIAIFLKKQNNSEEFTEENSPDNESPEEFINIKKETESLFQEQKKLIEEKEKILKQLKGIKNACAYLNRLTEAKEEVKREQATESAKKTKPKNEAEKE